VITRFSLNLWVHCTHARWLGKNDSDSAV